MTDYTELVKALRCCTSSSPDDCDICAYQPFCQRNGTGRERIMIDAAAAIEALQTELSSVIADAGARIGKAEAEVKRLEPKRGEWILTNDEIETIRIHMNAIKEQLCNQYRHREAEAYQTIVDKLAKMEVQE